jgi:hypothetical protein
VSAAHDSIAKSLADLGYGTDAISWAQRRFDREPPGTIRNPAGWIRSVVEDYDPSAPVDEDDSTTARTWEAAARFSDVWLEEQQQHKAIVEQERTRNGGKAPSVWQDAKRRLAGTDGEAA